jgi:hypothetical protein
MPSRPKINSPTSFFFAIKTAEHVIDLTAPALSGPTTAEDRYRESMLYKDKR